MNTSEVKKKIHITSFDDLYKYAKKQFLTYEVVEGIIPKATDKAWEEYDFSLDCPQDQLMLKDMLEIRMVEELTEASADMENKDHFFEEITDALNFFLSAMVMIGVDFKSLDSPEEYLERDHPTRPEVDLRWVPDKQSFYFKTYGVVHQVGYLCNLLKNRPWSQSNYLVSMVDFNERLKELWNIFWKYLGFLGISTHWVFDMFERKYSVNFFRIESRY